MNKQKNSESISSFETEFDFDTVKKYLPKNYLSEIQNQIKNVVSVRQIIYVLNGERNDHYGILDAAIDLAFKEKKRRKLKSQRLNKLK